MGKIKNIKLVETIVVTLLIAIMYSFYIFAIQFIGVNLLLRPTAHILAEATIVFFVLNLIPYINRRYLDYRYKRISLEKMQNRALVILGILINSFILMGVCNILLTPLSLFNPNASQEHILIAEFILFLFLLLYTSVNHGIYYSKLFVKRSIQLEETESARLEYDIQHLRAQFNPGLIHQTLEFVEQHQETDKAIARNVLEQFSNALRYKIYEVNKPGVNLQRELDHLEAYAKLRGLVYTINVDTNIERAAEDYSTTPLLLHSILDLMYDCSSAKTSIQINGKSHEGSYVLKYNIVNLACCNDCTSTHEFQKAIEEFVNSEQYNIQTSYTQNNITIEITFLQN